MVHRRGRDDRRLVGRLRGAAGRRRATRRRCAAIVPIHASDDRYADDVHYFGGCVLATDMVHWSACMSAYVGQPPDPAVVGEGWRDAWRERLDAMEPWVATVARPPAPRRLLAPGLGVRALRARSPARCSRSAAGSTATATWCCAWSSTCGAPVRGLIGPWGHTGPEAGAPGPAIGFLQEVVRFFDHALKGDENGFFDEPALISYMQERDRPGDELRGAPGRWVADPAWPSPNVETRALALGGGRRALRGLQLTGLRGRRLVRRRRPGRRAGRPAARGRRVAVLGLRAARRARSSCSATRSPSSSSSADRPVAFVAVRLCDVAPDGSSSLIARGVLNLTHREGHDRVVPARAGRADDRARADAVDGVRRAGRPRAAARGLADVLALDLAVARAGHADRRGGARLELPVRARVGATRRCRPFGPPESGAALAEGVLAPGADGPDRAPRPRDRARRTSSSRGSTTAT